MRQVYILEKREGQWVLTLPVSSRIVSVLMRLPVRLSPYTIESARIGQDTTHYVSIQRKK
jgi:hypothetical protein